MCDFSYVSVKVASESWIFPCLCEFIRSIFNCLFVWDFSYLCIWLDKRPCLCVFGLTMYLCMELFEFVATTLSCWKEPSLLLRQTLPPISRTSSFPLSPRGWEVATRSFPAALGGGLIQISTAGSDVAFLTPACATDTLLRPPPLQWPPPLYCLPDSPELTSELMWTFYMTSRARQRPREFGDPLKLFRSLLFRRHYNLFQQKCQSLTTKIVGFISSTSLGKKSINS